MSVRCPKCKFDSPDEAAWCDFCKEPFRKPAAAPPAAEALPAAARKLLAVGDPEQVPRLPPWFLKAAWVFLAFWSCAAIGLLALLWTKRR